ncbi:hypothetical protein EV672_107103 [Aquabacterium commune]|uniref:Uncharacterized protein n=1 Tax=Aquabacterium commune TaxID=70586 RepID=A0A4R6R733_9BURK|nr:hypothetical protein [Aquabacterium commune]TDP81672.1 hypothetical protein EV672_107103 [Aquabacterium commune]
MIARPFPRPGPIPFADAALQALMPSVGLTPAWMASQGRGHGGNSGGGHGGAKGQAPHGGRHPAHAHRQESASPQRGRDMHATFHGHGVLSVRSSATGALYRFEGHGARLAIDPRDALLLGRLSDVHVG